MFENQQIAEIFQALEISRSDTVLLHGDAAIVSQFNWYSKKMDSNWFTNSILEYFASSGSLVVPTFTYSFTKKQAFEPLKTPSAIGQFSEMFRLNSRMIRTTHPIFSVMVIGELEEKVLNSSVEDCFGPNTFFDVLAKANGKVVTLGCGIDKGLTYIHSIEQKMKVPYRFFKEFEGDLILDESKKLKVSYFVRELKVSTELNVTRLIQELKTKEKIKSCMFGRLICQSVRISDLDEVGQRMLNLDPFYFTRGGAEVGN